MQYKQLIVIRITVSPSQLDENIKETVFNLIKEKYQQTLFKTFYISEILETSFSSHGKINNDGSVTYLVNTDCIIVNPTIGNSYSLVITHNNKLGFMHKSDLVTIFVPKQYTNRNLAINEEVTINIVGKRVEERIVCVGTIE
tara:strand:+ start:475 stop:900 length:426 start_codon:yes stop_codon:yes gene_type:complete